MKTANKFNKKIYSLLLFILMALSGISQNVGINENGSQPNSSAGLDVDFHDKGILIPRISLTSSSSFAPLSAHVAGMIVYNTATTSDVVPGFYYNNGVSWVRGFLKGGATGDMLYWNGLQWTMVPIGQPGQFLQISNSNIPSWGGTNTIYSSLTTSPATSITTTAATSGGIVTADNGSAVIIRGVCWNTIGSPTIANSRTTDGSGIGSFVSSISSLLPATTYYVRSYTITSTVVTYGNEITFTTNASLPTLATTTAASAITGSTANSGGNVTADGGAAIIERGICYGTTSNPTIIANTKIVDAAPGTGSFISNITGLNGGTLYYVRAYATNSVGTAYGTQISFTTTVIPPTLITVAATNIAGASATSGASMNWNGPGYSNFQNYGVAYSTSPGSLTPTFVATNTTNGSVNPNVPIAPWVTNIPGLAANTTYYIRAYLNVYRSGWITVYGNELSFTTTAPTAPIVASTTAVSNLSANSARSGGAIASDGGAAITAKGVCWSTSASPTLGVGNFTTDGTGTASFISNITGLTANTLYYVRAYATNSVGTSYGPANITFTTWAQAPYTLGQDLGYGIVAYVSPAGSGFIVSYDIPSTAPWGCPGTAITLSATLGSGLANTNAILAACATRPIAASVAKNYNGGGFNDWYLPSSGEWAQIMTGAYSNLYYHSTNNFYTSTGYLSNNNYASTVFYNSNSGYASGAQRIPGANDYVYYLRAIRDFGPAALATVTTDAVTNIAGTSGTSGGNVTSDGNAAVTERGVCWSTSPNPTIADSKTTDGAGTGIFVSSITGLTSGVLYYIRAYAKNIAGTAYGNEVTYTPLGASIPTITTDTITNKTAISGTSGGNITSDGGAAVTARGVCWSLNSNPTTADSITSNGTGIGTFVSNINNLTTGYGYFIRAYATNSVGTAYGNEIYYSPFGAPVVTTEAIYYDYAAIPVETTATSGGQVVSDGGSPLTASGICWNTSTGPTITTNLGITNDNINIGWYGSTITGLVTGTTYYVRAYATNTGGLTSYGQEIVFTPGVVGLATVNTGNIVNLIGAIAEGSGNILTDGGDPITGSGLVWGSSVDPTITTNIGMTAEFWSLGVFYSTMTGLSIGTTYHVRAYATNSAGTAYGADVTFTATAATIGQVISGGNMFGNVFSVDGTGLHGLIADAWGFGVSDWGCTSTSIGTTGTAIGTGAANTTAIINDIVNNACASPSMYAAYAAEISRWYGPDWYLPSKDEFDLLWTNRVAAGVDGAISTAFPFWSSSEYDNVKAWYFDGTNWLSTGLKTDQYMVWPIRSF